MNARRRRDPGRAAGRPRRRRAALPAPGAHAARRQRRRARPPLLKDLKAADIAAIRIVEPKATLTLAAQGRRLGHRRARATSRPTSPRCASSWCKADRPQGRPERADRRQGPRAAQPGREPARRSSSPAPTASRSRKLVVGKKYFKREVENPDKALADGRFVALPGEPETGLHRLRPAYAGDARRAPNGSTTRSFQVEKVKTLEVRYPEGERLAHRARRRQRRLEARRREARREARQSAGPTPPPTRSSLLELADVAPEDATDTGLDKPTSIQRDHARRPDLRHQGRQARGRQLLRAL